MSEHSLILVLPGDVAGVRARLIAALERLDYSVIDDQPVLARRRARNLGILSTNVLNYSVELTVGLQPHGEQATRATFYYRWKHIWGAIGDRRTLEREAEALAALATLHTKVTACDACGAEGVAETRFCRRCGAPLGAAEPAELEVLRLTTAINSASKANSLAFVMGALALISLVLAVFSINKSTFFIWYSAAIGLIVWIAAVVAGFRLANTLGLKIGREELLAGREKDAARPPAIQHMRRPRLEQPASIAESTTEFMPPIKEPARPRDPASKRDTDTGL